MPVNRNALIRYRVIDSCLRNRYRTWSLEDLVDACSDALYEAEGVDKGVSRRTVQADIETMRSGKLGYEAPIVVVDKRYYTYQDRSFSIHKIPLDAQDIHLLSEISGLLRQFKGLNHYAELAEMVSKVEDKLHAQRSRSSPVVDFEKNEHLKGLEWLEPLRQAIVARRCVVITYQSFKAMNAAEMPFSAYLLKEYRNRWFVLGRAHKRGAPLLNLALDRIRTIHDHHDTYRANEEIDLATYYSDVIGVTKTFAQRPTTVMFWVRADSVPYVQTKPLHPTQKVCREDADGVIFSIQVIMNFELERELIGFGDDLKVLRPGILQRRIRERLGRAHALYGITDDKPPRSTDAVREL